MKYSPTLTDLQTFLAMDSLLAPDTPVEGLVAALGSSQWQLQQAALWSIATRFAAPGALAPAPVATAVLDLLDEQDSLAIYGSADHWKFEDPDPTVQEEHRCRFRVKQAAVMALAALALRMDGGDPLRATAIERIERYATSMADDYAVRAEACRALGAIASPSSRATLERAAADGEWCTATEAAKSLSRLPKVC